MLASTPLTGAVAPKDKALGLVVLAKIRLASMLIPCWLIKFKPKVMGRCSLVSKNCDNLVLPLSGMSALALARTLLRTWL